MNIKRSTKAQSRIQPKALRRLSTDSTVERLALLQVETSGGIMSNLMTNFDWKGYAKDIQKDNNNLRILVDKMAGWILGLGFVSIWMLITIAILLWRK